ncbi:hypothetical protein WCP94_001561 [Bilophila wadsworthia]
MGKGGKTFLKKSFSLPSPNPIPPFLKTFNFIESLFPAFPVGKKKSLNNMFRLFIWKGISLNRWKRVS